MLYSLLARSAGAGIILTAVSICAFGTQLTTAHAATRNQSATAVAPLSEGVGMGARPSAPVRRVQRILERRGFDVGAPGVDGRFGPLTAAAVRRMQAFYGLAADGIVGTKTRRVLNLLTDRQQAARERGGPGAEPPRERAPAPAPAQPRPRERAPERQQPQPPGTTAQPTPDRQPAITTGAQDRGRDTTLPTALAAFAALLAAVALAVALLRRSRAGDTTQLVSIQREMFLEGQSEDEKVGRFRGIAVAAALPVGVEDYGREARYLVDDPTKPAPVWVHGREVDRAPSPLAAGEPVIGYVITDRPPSPEHSSLVAVEAKCAEAGWQLREVVRDDETRTIFDRPGLTYALEQIGAGRARGLVVTDAKRLTASAADLGALLEWFRDADAALVIPELELDTSTVRGAHTASTLITLSAWERERIPARTWTGAGRVPPRDRGEGEHDELVDRIVAMRESGMTLQAIADRLNEEGVPTPRGTGEWRRSTVQAALARRARPESPRFRVRYIPPQERDR
jgi:peptidoglycan hydrolase-like protein with peptidoglycan-binding domain/DNA invertase Pin-like site-specific DNA recombinase